MKKQKMLAQAITLGLLLAVPFGAYAGETLNIDKDTDLTTIGSEWHGTSGTSSDIWHGTSFNDNEITVDGAVVDVGIYGGYTAWNSKVEGDLNNNSVYIKNHATVNGIIHGALVRNGGDASYNNITIENSTINGALYAVHGEVTSNGGSGDVCNNTITIKDSTVTVDNMNGDNRVIVAGYGRGEGEVAYNKVVIENSTIGANNTVSIFGAYRRWAPQSTSDAYNNSVEISKSTINGSVYGASITGGVSYNNTVSITDSTVTGNILGGTNNNTVTISGASVISGSVKGGSGNGNQVIINDGTFKEGSSITGGHTIGGVVENNRVVLNSGTINGKVYAAYAEQNYSGLKLSDNTILLTGTVDVSNATMYGVNDYIRYDRTSTSGNTLIVDSNWKNENVKKLAYFNLLEFANLTLDENSTLTLSADEVSNLYKASSVIDAYNVTEATDLAAGDKITTTIKLNNITLGSADVDTSKATGDYIVETNGNVRLHGVEATGSSNKENNNTTITITGEITKSVLAGQYTKGEETLGTGVVNITADTKTNASQIVGAYSVDGDATGGTIVLNNGTDGKAYNLYGGFSEAVDVDATAGNTLVVNGISTANSVNNFESVTFNNLKVNDGTAYLTVTNNQASSDLSKAKINMTFASGTVLHVGDVFALIDGNVGNIDTAVTSAAGIGLDIESGIKTVDDVTYYNVASAKASAQTKMLTESRSAATAFVNQGADMVMDSLGTLAEGEKGLQVFAATSGSKGRYETGSHVDVNGWNTIVGVGNKKDNFAWGAFFENGDSNYSAFTDNLRGDGSAVYNGGGLMARYSQDSGLYYEASVRAGVLKNELNDALIDRSTGKAYGYDIDTPYYGAHFGLGKVFAAGEGTIDAYAKYIYTHHDSESFVMSSENFKLDSGDSNRLRLGLRFTNNDSAKLKVYYGAAWEYEFDGKANGTTSGYDIEEASLKGSTVIGELGASYKASDKWFLDASLKGYGGQRDGFSGKVQVNYLF